MTDEKNVRIGIIGLGYVGLPLAVEFGKKFETIGFDLNVNRIKELSYGIDSTLEVDNDDLKNASHLRYSANPEALLSCNFFIVAVPTPIDRSKRPDLTPLVSATEIVARFLSKGDIVVYESTVFPGATEDVCVPILEKISGMKFNTDFFCGYSPERINPGDKEHRLPDIVKITSGSTPEIAETVDSLYRSIIRAGTHKAGSIKVAEAAKVIENTQRDVNIALVNELALIFNKLDISTYDVLEAAGTKWNFLPFTPGLVGGHCIGVDPYYLTHKAQEVGYHPNMILAGRRLNDDMGRYIASQVIKLMLKKNIEVSKARILILGLTFKENCPDLRNTKVVDIIDELTDYGIDVDVYDPWVDVREAKEMYNIRMLEVPETGLYDAVVLTVAHSQFRDQGIDYFRGLAKEQSVIFDVKNLLPRETVDGAL